MKLGTDCNDEEDGDITPLMAAMILDGATAIKTARLLIELGADLQATISITPASFVLKQPMLANALHYACLRGELVSVRFASKGVMSMITPASFMQAMVEFLVNEGCMDIDSGKGGFTPLVLACIRNRDNVVSWLIAAGADKEASVLGYGTLLHFMCYYTTHKIKSIKKQTSKDTAEIRILTSGDIAMMQLLLDHGAEVNTAGCNEYGYTPLFTCAAMDFVVRLY
jgi:ankyrin repeat protein